MDSLIIRQAKKQKNIKRGDYIVIKKKKRKIKIDGKGLFSKFIVLFCIIEMLCMQWWAMKIVQNQSMEVTGLITVNHGVFGGELLLLCLKRIFAKNKTGTVKTNEQMNGVADDEEVL